MGYLGHTCVVLTLPSIQVSDIPYASKFGGAGNVDMKLSEYIDEVRVVELWGDSMS
jgi:hypothetical protein